TSILKRKLCALALCILLTVSQPQVLDRLVQILSVCTSVLHETEEDQNDGASGLDSGLPDPFSFCVLRVLVHMFREFI
ncbi:hypothetical protein KC19_VG165200, partial [Ceratodon purpureus]